MTMPVALVKSYLAMMPRLEAGETLDMATAVSLGSGTLKDSQKATRALVRAARGNSRLPNRKPDPAALALIGIRVVQNG